ncbi:hypothetical protein PHMEG_00037110 [Phytophthora megakarya]|uniref:ZSWIM1/3 RNaseH-like domain-containing protein n=1 Tax=Phytophthora megakarya TaxID=4795 RepID=A0A225UKC8_9STRA|nr:hypothetical protein PHMEG_00037110 [Phytophthora megakarya]
MTHSVLFEDEFCKQHEENSAVVVVDCATDTALVAKFQSEKDEVVFQSFSEVIMVDTTHDTNSNIYKLFSFVVHDSEYVHHAFVQTKHMVNLRVVVELFKSNNRE